MKKAIWGREITWEKLVVVMIKGVSPEKVATVIAPNMLVGVDEIRRIYEGKDGTLAQLRDTDADAGKAHQQLLDHYGKDRVLQIWPNVEG
ncbi:MAG: hypothetical protein PHF50_02035 [Patescibacteria group bacterium]|nr:hypothetical protein [Patescibacteria group bacterium]